MTNRFKGTRGRTPIPAAMWVGESGEQHEAVVPGIRPSLSKSREAKRESRTVVDVLAAEDVGKFPDRKVTEAFSVLVA